MRLVFTAKGWEDYQSWQRLDRAVLKRVNRLIDDCLRDPFGGIGKPERRVFRELLNPDSLIVKKNCKVKISGPTGMRIKAPTATNATNKAQKIKSFNLLFFKFFPPCKKQG